MCVCVCVCVCLCVCVCVCVTLCWSSLISCDSHVIQVLITSKRKLLWFSGPIKMRSGCWATNLRLYFCAMTCNLLCSPASDTSLMCSWRVIKECVIRSCSSLPNGDWERETKVLLHTSYVHSFTCQLHGNLASVVSYVRVRLWGFYRYLFGQFPNLDLIRQNLLSKKRHFITTSRDQLVPQIRVTVLLCM